MSSAIGGDHNRASATRGLQSMGVRVSPFKPWEGSPNSQCKRSRTAFVRGSETRLAYKAHE